MDRIKTAGNSVNRVLLSENNRQEHSEKMITDPEFEKIMDLVEGLQAFYLATKTISAEKYVSRSLIVPLLNLIDNSVSIVPFFLSKFLINFHSFVFSLSSRIEIVYFYVN